MTTGTAAAVEELDLIEALRRQGWLKLPLAVMQDVGPATQTLGGILRITNRETFASVKSIAAKACLPVATVRKHLVTLHDHAWIINAGREHTRRGAPRRTCTIKIPPQTRGAMTTYAMLPWWAMCQPSRGKRLTWASKAVLSVVMSRLANMVKPVMELDGKADTYRD